MTYDAKASLEVIRSVGTAPELLLQILHALQERFGYIDDLAIRQLADELNLSRADVHGVVSFYHDFRRELPGKRVIKICQAEACQAMGSRSLTEHAIERLGTALNSTRADHEFTLEPVYCLGNCACSPAIMIDGDVFGRVDTKRFDALVGNSE